MKLRRNAWTDYPEDIKRQLFSASIPQDPLRTLLLKVFANSKSEQLPLKLVIGELSSVSDEALAQTLKEAHEDGIVTVRGDTISLTTLGHRASVALR